jgi:hypothetical protein
MQIAATLVAMSLLAPVPGNAAGGLRSAEVSAYQLASGTTAPADPEAWENLSPAQRMQKRWPQPVKVGFLIGLPVLDYDDSTIGHVRKVVRAPDGKILLIVDHGRWFTWTKRPVAVPIETVAILGRQIDALEFLPEDFDKAPTWNDSGGQDMAPDATVQIAIARR